jgi:hypothetical protein
MKWVKRIMLWEPRGSAALVHVYEIISIEDMNRGLGKCMVLSLSEPNPIK